VEGDAVGEGAGKGVFGPAGVSTGGASDVGQVGGVREDVRSGDAADPEELGGEGVQGFAGGEGVVERQGGEGVRVGFGGAMDAGGVGAGGDARKLDLSWSGLWVSYEDRTEAREPRKADVPALRVSST